MKRCKFCSEQIPDNALICPFCHHEVRKLTILEKAAVASTAKSGSRATNLISVLILIALVLFALFAITYRSSPPASSPAVSTSIPAAPVLPPHIIAKNTAITNGRRIEIHVEDPNLTKDECIALIDAYRDLARPAGQVSVRKPDQTGTLTPWCVDNLDGRPVIFNDSLFK